MSERIETFVFKFTDQEVFKEFFTKYYPLTADKQIPGMRCLSVASGDQIEENDKLLNLIGDLYDVATRSTWLNEKHDILERAEKLLGIT